VTSRGGARGRAGDRARLRIAMLPGDLAAYPVGYALGIAALVAHATGGSIVPDAFAFVALAAHAGYLLDRVKITDRAFDPADAMADPRRHERLRRWARALRVLMVVEWIFAIAIGWRVHPALSALVPAGVAAGLAYSGWPAGGPRRRLKDHTVLKSAMVASAHTALGAFAAFMSDPEPLVRRPLGVVASITGVWCIVAGDAVICDLDDRVSDGVHSTRSVPVVAGAFWSGAAAVSLLVLGSVMLIVSGSPMALASRTSIAAMLIFSASIILGAPNRRDWIDARMLPLVLYGLWLGA